MAETYNFTRIETTDHDFASFLRGLKAIDNFRALAASNIWTGPDGTDVALCFYDGALGVRYWVRTDLLRDGMVIASTNAAANVPSGDISPGLISTLHLRGALYGPVLQPRGRSDQLCVIRIDLDLRAEAKRLGRAASFRDVLSYILTRYGQAFQRCTFTTDTEMVLTTSRLTERGVRTAAVHTQALSSVRRVADLVEAEVYSYDFTGK